MLKLVALLAMVVDHLGAVFFPEQEWMRVIGRLAMPVFAYAVAKGFHHTSNRKKYLLRLGVLALISQVPFLLLFGHSWGIVNLGDFSIPLGTLNMIFPWAIALGLLMAPAYLIPLAVPLLLLVDMDYSALVILLPIAFYWLWVKTQRPILALLAAGGLLAIIAIISSPLQWFALLSLPLIYLLERFDSKVKVNRWLFYWFYPAHLVVIWGVAQILSIPTYGVIGS